MFEPHVCFTLQENSGRSEAASPLRRALFPYVLVVHVALAKIAPKLFSMPTFLLASRPSLAARTSGAQTFYQDVLTKQRATQRNMLLALALLAAVLAVTVHTMH
jgi:hypothetical protein